MMSRHWDHFERCCFRDEDISSKGEIRCRRLPDKAGGGIDQRKPIAFSDMDVTGHLSSQRKALEPPTEDRISGNQAQNPWEINTVDSLALRTDSTGS